MSSSNEKKIQITDLNLQILSNNIKTLMAKMSIDSHSLATQTGIALTTLNSLRRGAGNPTLSTLHALATFFKTTIGELTEKDISNKKGRKQYFEIPLLDISEMKDFILNKNKFKNTTTVELDEANPESFFAIEILNNVLSPLFEKGTIFIISNNLQIQDGDLVIVQFGSNLPCFRKIFIEDKTYFFRSISENLGENIIRSNNFTIHGVIVKAIQNFYM